MSDAIRTFLHLILLAVYTAAVFRVPQSFRALIHLHKITLFSGLLFFILCGGIQLGIILNKNGAVFLASEYIQAASLIVFIIWLAKDVARALKRLRLAFQAIQNVYGDDGDRMIATITTALQGK